MFLRIWLYVLLVGYLVCRLFNYLLVVFGVVGLVCCC